MASPDPRLAAALAAALLGVGPALRAAEPLDPLALATELAALGPRVGASAEAARELLLERMRAVGLSGIERLPLPEVTGGANLTGALPGSSGLEIVLGAHLDSVPTSPGAADDAAGCAVVLAAAARLRDLPRRHSLRLMLFDREESDLAGSRAWAGSLSAERREAVLAVVNVDTIGFEADAVGTVHLALTGVPGALRLPPGWLVHSLLRAGRAVAAPLGVGAERLGVPAQILARSFVSDRASDAEALLAAGLPAVTLSDADLFDRDPERHRRGDAARRLDAASLERWVSRVTAAARRLDALAGRPRSDDQYLAVVGRVWDRRSLYWICLASWVLLLLGAMPLTWRGRSAADRRRRGRAYLPGFTLRFLYLAAILTLPVLTTVLLLPAALVCAASSRWSIPARWAVALAVLPWMLLLLAMLRLASEGRLGAPALGLPALALLTATFGSMLWALTHRDPGSRPGREA